MGHHYVPQEYLRGFSHPSSPGALWQYDKKQARFSTDSASISKIAQQRSFYGKNTEPMLNELIEIPGNQVLRKLRSGDLVLSDPERRSLSVYIATMMKRVPDSRDRAKSMAPRALAEVASETRDQIRAYEEVGHISRHTAEASLAEVNKVEANYAANMPENVKNIVMSPWPTMEMIGFVYGMHWRFVAATGSQYFVTTDNPAFYFDSFGLGTKESELTFPVSSDLAIFGSWTPVDKAKRMISDDQLVKEANRRLIDRATRFVYYRSRADWIVKVAAKRVPHLSRIQW